MSEPQEWWIDVTTTYKVYNAPTAEDARDLVERYEDGDEQAMALVTVKDQSVEIERGL